MGGGVGGGPWSRGSSRCSAMRSWALARAVKPVASRPALRGSMAAEACTQQAPKSHEQHSSASSVGQQSQGAAVACSSRAAAMPSVPRRTVDSKQTRSRRNRSTSESNRAGRARGETRRFRGCSSDGYCLQNGSRRKIALDDHLVRSGGQRHQHGRVDPADDRHGDVGLRGQAQRGESVRVREVACIGAHDTDLEVLDSVGGHKVAEGEQARDRLRVRAAGLGLRAGRSHRERHGAEGAGTCHCSSSCRVTQDTPGFRRPP